MSYQWVKFCLSGLRSCTVDYIKELFFDNKNLCCGCIEIFCISVAADTHKLKERQSPQLPGSRVLLASTTWNWIYSASHVSMFFPGFGGDQRPIFCCLQNYRSELDSVESTAVFLDANIFFLSPRPWTLAFACRLLSCLFPASLSPEDECQLRFRPSKFLPLHLSINGVDDRAWKSDRIAKLRNKMHG